ncbi:Lrp/AsnC family transcriptional regulator [archaeon]|nr:Lrp/AsnC family transcriptional regulator [archaeon]
MTINLDLRDKGLLFEIDFDARKTYAELARKLRMSKRGVEYKLTNLEKKKVILGYAPIINISKLGYYYFRVFIKFQNLTPEFKTKIENYVKNKKEIGWFIWYYGSYDTGFTIWAKSVSEFKQSINEFYEKFGKNILNYKESIGISTNFYNNRYLLKTKDLKKITIKEETDKIKLDETDYKLLQAIIKKPRESIVNISITLKESPKKIAYRLKKLKEKEILLAIRPRINHELLGKTYFKAFLYLNNFNRLKELEQYISNDPRVIYLIKALGTCDLDVEIMVDSTQEFYSFIEGVQSKFPNTIKSYETMILGETIKSAFLPKNNH